jgi:hypothetical protein
MMLLKCRCSQAEAIAPPKLLLLSLLVLVLLMLLVVINVVVVRVVGCALVVASHRPEGMALAIPNTPCKEKHHNTKGEYKKLNNMQVH